MLAPPLLLNATTTSITAATNWSIEDGGDPWVGVPYQWTVTASVTTQAHSYPLSSTPYIYTAADIKVGYWYSDLVSGKAVKIISITSQNPSSITMVVEDVDRFNTFTDSTGNGIGIGNLGGGFIFEIGDDGLPILGPMIGFNTQLITSIGWQLDQISRFRYRNYLNSHYSVNQPGNTFSVNQPLFLQSSGSYSVIPPTSSSVKSFVGVVSDINVPGPGYFSFKPVGKTIRNVTPVLPGNPGDLIYIGSNGYTNVAPTSWARPIYINLGNGDGILLQNGVDTAGNLGYASHSNVVATPSALTTLSPNVGDTAFVSAADVGNEWNHVIYDGSKWVQLSNEASSVVDAQTLQATIGTSSTSVTVGTVGIDRCVVRATVQVTSAFNNGTSLNIGTQLAHSIVMDPSLVDLTTLGTYTCEPNAVLSSSNYSPILATITGTATQGSAIINITYV